jgi:hypothetical protein
MKKPAPNQTVLWTWWSDCVLGVGAFLLSACAASQPVTKPDLAEVLLPAPEAHVRSAVIQALTDAGYEVDRDDREVREFRTGYRQETESPWDWMLTSWFGTGRTRAEAVLTAESETATRLTIRVWHEGNDGLFASWFPYDPPLAQSAGDHLRVVKNALGLL